MDITRVYVDDDNAVYHKVNDNETYTCEYSVPQMLCNLRGAKGGDLVERISNQYGSVKNICIRLGSSPENGLIDNEQSIRNRRSQLGANFIEPKPQKSFLRYVIEALNDVTLIVLTIAAIVSLVLSFIEANKSSAKSDPTKGLEWIEGATILIAVVLIILVTAFNNWTKERQFRNLKKIVSGQQKFCTIRSGQVMNINNTELVVGDVCIVKYGDSIPADGLIIQSNDMKVDESSMTGESDPVKKGVHDDPLLLSGSHVLEGSGKMVIIRVGFDTDYGRALSLLTGSKPAAANIDAAYAATADGSNNRCGNGGEGFGGSCLGGFGVQKPNGAVNLEELSPDSVAIKTPSAAAVAGLSNTADGMFNDNDGDDYDAKSILKKKVDKLSIEIGYFGIVMAVATLIVLIVRFSIEKFAIEKLPWDSDYVHDFIGFVLIAITILVIAIPEGLPLAVLLSLAIAVKRMMKDKNLVRHLDACETMGNATCICSDKTGTLTTNVMTVVECYMASTTTNNNNNSNNNNNNNYNNENNNNNNKMQKGARKCSGNKTDCSLLGLLLDIKLDYNDVRKQYPQENFVKVYTFNSLRKYMGTAIKLVNNNSNNNSNNINNNNNNNNSNNNSFNSNTRVRLFVKGASEILLSKCTHVITKTGNPVEMTLAMKNSVIDDVIHKMATNGERTLCIAYRDFHDDANIDWDDENDIVSSLTLLCVVGIEDPVRSEVPMAIAKCQGAGITVRMITGDNLATARSIAKKCGILHSADEYDDRVVMESQQFNERIFSTNSSSHSVCTSFGISDNNSNNNLTNSFKQETMDQVWPRLRVLARSTPTDKYNLVKGIMNSRLTKDQEIVAVTGDGTNDGPALKKAHVGFAMGLTGTDVAKEASDIILTDDNFTSIIKAVVWGRHVFDSITKFLQFQLTVNVVAVFIAFISACFVADTPIKAVQMIWVNLIQDTLASLSLATEYPNESTIIILGDDLLGIKSGEDEDIRGIPNQHFTFIFNLLVIMSLFNEINCRKIDGTFNVFEDIQRSLLFTVLWSLTIFLQVIIVEFGGYAFFTTGLSIEQWMWCLFFGISELLLGLIINVLRFEVDQVMKRWNISEYTTLNKEHNVLID
ncbi:hypothetical protein HELRODRAFT_193907 [Helobdella robusta]|uniref:Cation-transporting P-type ATPase N-terminal domain-containing protein n=1 Tax=Helobdella robusta TaxID=6412 RepID=T1FVG8_HELRO|nr:hypothetical protein HELRODRAFT_193907 [Helobdella robusta]ESN93867.1 hypothetical protein HELRODRAFT_193907 [Helobdella robusta]